MLWPVLGLMRFLLALIVAHGHFGLVVHGGWLSRMAGNLPGVAAVFCFLVISGYSIAPSYQQSPSGFYFRRLLHLHPLYVLTVLVGAALPLLIALIVMLTATRINYLMLTTWSVYIFAVATLAIGFAGRLPFNLPAAKLFSYPGAISYPLFLIHLPVFLVFRAMNAPPSIGWFLIAVLAVACALDALYDRPVKAAIRRLFASRSKVGHLAPSARAHVAT